MSLHEQTQKVQPLRRYLFFPWIALLLVGLAFATGITDWISTLLPFGIGRMAIRNLWLGMLLFLLGCSTLWALGVQRSSYYRGAELIVRTIRLAFLVSVIQILIFWVGAIFFQVALASCLFRDTLRCLA